MAKTTLSVELSNEKVLEVGSVNKAYDFISAYDAKYETISITLSEDQVAVSIVKKDLKPSQEAMAEMMGCSQGLLDSVIYMDFIGKKREDVCEALSIAPEEYDRFLEIMS